MISGIAAVEARVGSQVTTGEGRLFRLSPVGLREVVFRSVMSLDDSEQVALVPVWNQVKRNADAIFGR